MHVTADSLRAFAARPWAEIEARSQRSMRHGMSPEQRLMASASLAELRRLQPEFGRDRADDLAHHIKISAAFESIRACRLPGRP